ncbi:hypothetical protein K505DRAFT_359587 [Melanomma pulvis-pyrius CBS 109.77]|uniref:Uncharacterized protein n=1 Tax=Melanomma pulvis-pyrius CBS 109.77 TaxID=1314802 RepID=A0A6A6XKN6_9PLEO|nr:hypothetical protein K505DRAFT_359587 [Melanomma pulvis-pyrius CBS 109.77]
MPTYLATNIRMRLSATSLPDTTTRSIERNKGEAAARKTEAAQTKLKESDFLPEERLQFPGDVKNFGLNFLKNVPFMQVQVGADLFEVCPELKSKRRRASVRSARVSPKSEDVGKEDKEGALSGVGQRVYRHSTRAHPAPSPSSIETTSASRFQPSPWTDSEEMAPKALVLHVILSNETFLCSFEDGKPQRLMIDVFFNGALVSSILAQPKHTESFHLVFAGTRVDNMAERPWVVLPPGQNADGSLRGLKRAISVKERWQQICWALLEEVKERGVDEYGERSPSADYLQSLATMEMPEAIERLQKPGGRRFGVIDVVVTAGSGKKLNNGMPYLKNPMRLVDKRYRRRYGEEQTLGSQPEQVQHRDAEGEADLDLEQEALAPTSWPVTTLLPSSILPPPMRNPKLLSQLPHLPTMQSSTPIFPPSLTAVPVPLSTPEFKSGRSPRGSISQLNTSSFGTPMRLGSIPVLGSSYPSLLPSQARRVSFGHANVAEYNPGAPPSDTTQGLSISGHEMFPIPESPTEISPLAHRTSGSRGPVSFRGDPFDHRLNRPPLGPPPPVGFFSALPQIKPRVPTVQGTIDTNLPPLSFLLSRLVITGKNGVTIVDHHWFVAQRIARKRTNPNRQRSPIRARKLSPGSAEYSELSTRARRGSSGSRSDHRLTTPPPTSSGLVNSDLTMSVDKMKRDSIHDGTFRNPMFPPTIGPALASVAEMLPLGTIGQIDNDEPAAEDGDVTMPNTPAGVFYRRGKQTLPFSSVQGPNTAPFIFEDPEELMRRRVGSPTKAGTIPVDITPDPSQLSSVPRAAHFTSSTPVNPSSISNISSLLGSGSSSLSSAPSSPDLETSHTMVSVQATTASQATNPPQHVSIFQVPVVSENTSASELQPPPGKKLRTLSMSSAPSSPELPLSEAVRVAHVVTASAPAPHPTIQAQPRLQVQPITPTQSLLSSTSTSTTSAQPPQKKRSNISPSRSRPFTVLADTGDNPPLNQDCVIAYAVSQSEERDLRQVKSERQGVFREEEVVVGMRFFVAG